MESVAVGVWPQLPWRDVDSSGGPRGVAGEHHPTPLPQGQLLAMSPDVLSAISPAVHVSKGLSRPRQGFFEPTRDESSVLVKYELTK